MPKKVAALLVLAAAGPVTLLALAALDERELAFGIGVVPNHLAVTLEPGKEACQAPISVATDFSAVRVAEPADGRAGPPLAIRVRQLGTGRTLAGGRAPAGQRPGGRRTARMRTVREGERVAVCIRNAGKRPAPLMGGPEQAARTSRMLVGGLPTQEDLTVDFLRRRPSSLLELVPDMFRRAALWHPGWVGAWTFWLLAALIGLAVPAMLLRAVLSADSEPAD